MIGHDGASALEALLELIAHAVNALLSHGTASNES
jgi:hypothetical protein